ncbi:hypothetical protein [Baekduia sp.]|jgi:hypothetical protein|uniref:hypothetical protein n=1 Tax=Baekduia sp. TaxID=2600305 RepID=UPI002DFF95F5|nr:hypothetical protein [Baekduia sp.]
MTAHHTPPSEDPLPGDAESAAIGRHIQQLAREVEAPATLRMRLADAQPSAGTRRRFALPALGGLGLAALAAVVLLLVGLGGGSSAPSVDDAVALALAPATAPAPAIDPVNTQVVRERIGGITFPNYSYAWPKWKTTGARRDRLSGRDAMTVVYRGPRGDVGYTIVDGKPLDPPDGARHVRAGGVDLSIVRRDGATVVTWERDGHTCVLAGRGAGVEQQLVRFAAWA